MRIKLHYQELQQLKTGLLLWLGDLEEDESQQPLQEVQLYRRYHLRSILQRVEIKLVKKRGEITLFPMEFESVEVFTLLRIYEGEEDERVIRLLRPLMAKFDEGKTVHFYAPIPNVLHDPG